MAYTTSEKVWVPNWVDVQVPAGHYVVEHEEPVYEWQDVQVGTEVEWELVEDPAYESRLVAASQWRDAQNLDVGEYLNDIWKDLIGYGKKVWDAAAIWLAARQISIAELEGTLRIYGPRDARSRIGWREMTNWLRPVNANRLPLTAAERARGSLTSGGLALGLGLGLVRDTQLYLEGEYDRHEYAAALTVDTGATIAIAMAAGAAAGFSAGVATGGATGTAVAPGPGTGAGLIVGGVIGAIVGIFTALALGIVFTATKFRKYTIEEVADLYRDWFPDDRSQLRDGQIP